MKVSSESTTGDGAVPLDAAFYRRPDVLLVARELLGKVVFTRIGGIETSAAITETEAYIGPWDRASHAWGGRRTRRTEPMYAAGGVAYVYLVYGLHHLFNIVTNVQDVPHAVLVRAGIPLDGVDAMLARRSKTAQDKNLMGGPGTFSQALGITTALTGTSLVDGGEIRIEDRGFAVPDNAVTTGPRIGIDYAGEDAKLPYRFVVEPALLSVD